MDFTFLREFMDSLPRRGMPGGDVAVYRDHKELYRYTAGRPECCGGAPLQGNELYFLYSCSKIITCTAALQLFSRGKFSMSDPVSDVLPEFRDVRVRCGAYTVEPKREITFRDLFTMRSGLSYNLTSPYLQEVREMTGGRCPLREAVRGIAKMPLDFHPGEHFGYGLSHDVLAAAVEVISGMPFEDYVKKNIFAPCGMTESTFRFNSLIAERMASQYRYNGKTGKAETAPLTNMYVLGSDYDCGGAGLISSVRDLILFADAMACGGVAATGGQILSAHMIDMMRTNALDEKQREEFSFRWRCYEGYGYGLGVRTMMDRSAGGPGPLGEFGWQGAAGSYVLIDPENRLSLFYAQHMLNNQEDYVIPRIKQCLYGALRFDQ
jgi:CubicO group peptidase (beta-lactamase class C family)